MKLRMTQAQSRMLAVGLLLVVLLSIYAGLIRPAESLYHANDALIEELQQREFNYLRLTRRRDELEQKKTQLVGLQSASYYLKSDTETLAAADLQAFVKKLIERANGRLVSIQPLPTPRNGMIQEIKIQVRLQGGTETLRRVLYELETGTPLLLIRNLSIGQETAVRRRTVRSPDQETADTLNVSFDLVGFMRVKTT